MDGTETTTGRIIIADDVPHVRTAMRTMLTLALGATVVGEAGTAQELLDLLATTPTDIIIMDRDLTGMEDEAVVREISRRVPQCRILLCSVFDRADMHDCPIKPDFTLSKSLGPEHWIKALHALLTQQPPGIINVAVEKTPQMRAMIEAHASGNADPAPHPTEKRSQPHRP